MSLFRLDEKLITVLDSKDKPADRTFAYGTAGFRTDAAVMDSIFLRMGILAALRAVQTGKNVGLMVTASHNKIADNGIKMIDPQGDMLAMSWEGYATELANAQGGKAVVEVIKKIQSAENISNEDKSPNVKVFLGRDTRPHSKPLSDLACLGINTVTDATYKICEDLGVLTTPQLHHIVRASNSDDLQESKYASESGFYQKLCSNYSLLIGSSIGNQNKVVVDCAHGVGGVKLQELVKHFSKENVPLNVEVRNLGLGADLQKLNHKVGAEHVQKQQQLPIGTFTKADRMTRCASFDGDADRIVYYYVDLSGCFHLIDGDKIAVLYATYIQKQLKLLPSELRDKYTVGVVQTAYANGNSMRYLKQQLGINAPLAKTGVKYVHHKAVEYDIGIYFEANGHGTALFKEAMLKEFKQVYESESFNGEKVSEQQLTALNQLILLSNVINQATGDAIADLLACEAILAIERLSVEDWDKLYVELPSRQLKVKVADRTVITTTDDETKTLTPEALQPKLDQIVATYSEGRAFVRPSGTEDCVRVYAEAATVDTANSLACDVAVAAYELAGGVGEKPVLPQDPPNKKQKLN